MEACIPVLACIVLIVIHLHFVHAQETENGSGILSPLALGGMVHGLLNMQIRPEGGFFEERYKEIFPDDVDVPLATAIDHDRLHGMPNYVVIENVLSEDGKSLTEALTGKSPNPCFDNDRITRNRLLFLVCSLQHANMSLVSDEVK